MGRQAILNPGATGEQGGAQRLEGIRNGLEVLLASKAVGRKPSLRLINRSPSFAGLASLPGRIGSSDEKGRRSRGAPRTPQPAATRGPRSRNESGARTQKAAAREVLDVSGRL
jgi:hypothetical protein